MATISNSITWKSLISFTVMIILLFGAFIGIETRYLKAEDAYKKFEKIDKSLDRIYVQQLKQEAREILKDLQWRPANQTDKNRLGDIAAELKKLESTWIMPEIPSTIGQ